MAEENSTSESFDLDRLRELIEMMVEHGLTDPLQQARYEFGYACAR